MKRGRARKTPATKGSTALPFAETPGTWESSEDLLPISSEDIRSVSVSATDWTTETILSQINKGNIFLNPRFQRRDAWEISRKSRFIESLLVGFPVPPIVLAEQRSERGQYIVLDGKQRLLSISQFAAGSSGAGFVQFALEGLTLRSELNGLRYDDFNTQSTLAAELRNFENQPIRTIVVRHWSNENILYHVFLRLNTGNKPLSPQELRQALHPGLFMDYADDAASNTRALQEILGIDEPDFRMRDVELLIRYFAFRNFGHRYRGNLKLFLDETCRTFNKAFISVERHLETQRQQLEDAHEAIKEIFGSDYRYSKWTGAEFEARFNRAVFDVLIYPLLEGGPRAQILKKGSSYENAFKKICETDAQFVESIERTTKSLTATSYRFISWIKAVNKAFGTKLDAPVSTPT